MNKAVRNKLAATFMLCCLFLTFAQPAFAVPGDIINLNFGINNSYPWIQTVCGDMRMDNGVTNKSPAGLPSIATNATCPQPGIVFTGNGSPNFGTGFASTSNQIVGGSSYPEVYTPPGAGGIFSSYTYLNQKAHSGGLTTIDLATVCTLSNCSLPNNLAKGIYQANGNVVLNSTTFQPNRSYIFLINGSLTINGNILLLPSASAFFSASGDIIIPASVGNPAGVTTANLQGILSTDKSFVLQTNNNCTDLALNIEGSLIVNAGRSGGQLLNNRSLCVNNITTPTMRITQRLDYVLALPDFFKIQKITSQEVNP